MFLLRFAHARRFFLLTMALALCCAAQVGAEDGARIAPELIDQIEEACLRAYTPEMLAKMAADNPEANDIPQDELLEDFFIVDKGRFYPFFLADLADAFSVYVKPGKRFLDLGSGDGRVVFLAAALGAEATGIEYDPQVFKTSERALVALGDAIDAEKVDLIAGDFFEHRWSGYDVIFYFDLGTFEQNALRKKIALELDPGALLFVGHQRAPFPGLDLVTTFESIHVYQRPGEMPHAAEFEKIARREILDYHRFLQLWRNGVVEKTDEEFARVEDAVARGFAMLGADGATIYREAYVDDLLGEYGAWREAGSDLPGMGRVAVEDLRLRLLDGPVAVLTYQVAETRLGTRRVTYNTVVFRLRHGTPNGVEWYHVHSSLLP